MYQNVDGVKFKSESIKTWSELSNLIALSENHASNTDSDFYFRDLEHISIFRTDRNINGGGVAIIISNRLGFVRASEYEN